tara:strand:+ start:173 stop:334 length:162 start_codon:yes stop_codon:yes gene_type:complete
MLEMAKAYFIKVILCSVTIAKDYQWKPRMNPDLMIPNLNGMIKKYCAKNKVVI